MIEFLWQRLNEQWSDLLSFLTGTFDPFRDTLDILLVFLALYWVLLLIKGTRAVQILFGVALLVAARLVAGLAELATLQWILDTFFVYGVLIIIIIFQADIRRALARMGAFLPRVGEGQESQILEEVVRAAQVMAQKRIGALIALERESQLEDLIEAGTPLDAVVSKDLLTSIFLPHSPLHDGAVVIQGGRITHAGCILPLTLRTDLPEGVGTRHRAAVGITEETDAVVIVVSEETAAMSVVVGGEMVRGLDAPRLRGLLRDLFMRGQEDLEDEDLEAADSVATAGDERPAPTPADLKSTG